MKSVNIILTLFLIVQSTNIYSNILRRATNMIALRANSLVLSITQKSKNIIKTNTKQRNSFYSTFEQNLVKKANEVPKLTKQNQTSIIRNLSIKPIINPKESNIKNVGLRTALGISGACLCLSQSNISCAPDFSKFTFKDLCNYLKKNPNSLEEIFPFIEDYDYKTFIKIFPNHKEQIFKLIKRDFSNSMYEYKRCKTIKLMADMFPDYNDQLFKMVSDDFSDCEFSNIKVLIRLFPNYHSQLLELALDNFTKCKFKNHEISSISEAFPDHREQFFQLIISSLANKKTINARLIREIARAFPKQSDQLLAFVKSNLSKILYVLVDTEEESRKELKKKGDLDEAMGFLLEAFYPNINCIYILEAAAKFYRRQLIIRATNRFLRKITLSKENLFEGI